MKNSTDVTPLYHKKDLTDFLYGVCGKDGKPKTDTALFVPIALSFEQNKADGADGIKWTFSTFDIDRFDERVDPLGWELGHYKKNPVVQWAHRYDIPAIGRTENLYADDSGLNGSIVFNAKEYDAFGWAIGERVKAGVLRAGSVGFRILEIELPGKNAPADGTTLIFRKQELLEFSICNVPANPFALSQADMFLSDTKNDKNIRNIPPDFWGGLLNSEQ
ncbi:MAG: HK97 family phage prohead protease [Spirochaetaceae bacterium]|nr:HK97 family phage prohead protease [Spirochaetaceae bacterium]